MKNKEYETRYLLRKLPDCEPDERIHIEQGYLYNEKGQQIRVRRSIKFDNVKNTKEKAVCELTIKTYHSSTDRTEENLPITHEMYNTLISKADRVVSKYRYKYWFKGIQGPWEVDQFDIDPHNQIFIAEFEAPHNKYLVIIPQIIEECSPRNIDGEYLYTNYALAKEVER